MMSSSLNISQEDALRLVQNGASVLCLNCPDKLQFGFDQMSWTIGPKFRGMKMIPPGIHFIHYCPHAATQGKVGQFVSLESKQVMVLMWNEDDETLHEVEGEEAERFAAGVRRMNFDAGMAPYPFKQCAEWPALCKFITTNLIQKIQPIGGAMNVFEPGTFVSKRSKNASRPSQEADVKGSDFKQPLDGLKAKCGYSTVPVARRPTNTRDLAAITAFNLDKTPVLLKLLQSEFGADATGLTLLGELQFAYISLFLGHSFEGLDQWKALVHLLCNCEQALVTHPSLFLNFVRVMHTQMHLISESFFLTDLTDGNFLRKALQDFFLIVSESEGEIESNLHRHAMKLQRFIERKFKWSFNEFDDDDEYAPVIVAVEETKSMDIDS